MKTLKINASTSYNVIVGSGLLSDLSTLVNAVVNPCRIAVITDKNVDKLYSVKVIDNLKNGGYNVFKYVIDGGEDSKSGVEFLNILEFLAKNGFTRSDCLVALGGGVVGDLTGFVASSFLRGVKFVQVPTTLLAFADSSVGGKTAINLKAGKNLAGAFYQPALVVCDIDTMKTLPDIEFKCGMAEIIKYGMISDKDLLSLIASGMTDKAEDIIYRCIDLKRSVVERDEFDNGDRQLLNFGHTLGHAIERKSDFSIPHGIAVGMGMCLITERAVKKGYVNDHVLTTLQSVLNVYGLTDTCKYTLDELFEITMIDKKRKDDKITVVIPKTVGTCVLKKFTTTEWKEFLLN
ncbi:MAG: 3-dehydroquinate synthase [Clostridiales bacterium]|nr:3-dehydroquinate synthase [Clostridiales bacterium]